MKFTQKKKEDILFKIAKQIKYSPGISVSQISAHVGISRTSCQKYIRELEEKGLLRKDKNSCRNLKVLSTLRHVMPNTDIDESDVYDKYIAPSIKALHTECVRKFNYACTEMINNVVDHSEGSVLRIAIIEDYVSFQIRIIDNGIGIFKKIADGFNLRSINDAILELDKGKCTTDPERHTGEGIFFSSKMFDMFVIQANGMTYISKNDLPSSYLIENTKRTRINGTCVIMELAKDNAVPCKEIFDRFCEDDCFNKTIIPVVHLIDRRNTSDMTLVSRSQAKRLLARFDRFKNIILDFEEIDSVGQAFADEIFRVYKTKYPDIDISCINANTEISRMITRVRNTAKL